MDCRWTHFSLIEGYLLDKIMNKLVSLSFLYLLGSKSLVTNDWKIPIFFLYLLFWNTTLEVYMLQN